MLPQPRAYVDWTVPYDDQGNEIGVCHDPEMYSRYLGWLTDYLYATAIPLPKVQIELLGEQNNAYHYRLTGLKK